MSSTVTNIVNNDTLDPADQVEVGKLLVSDGKQFKVEWDSEAKVTPMGSRVYFAQYLQSGGLMSGLCKNTPLNYTSEALAKLFVLRTNATSFIAYLLVNLHKFTCSVGSSRHDAAEGEDGRTEIRWFCKNLK